MWIGDGSAASSQGQRDGCTRGVCIRPSTQLEAHWRWSAVPGWCRGLFHVRPDLFTTTEQEQNTYRAERHTRPTRGDESEQTSFSHRQPSEGQTDRPRLPSHRRDSLRAETSRPANTTSHQQWEPLPMLCWLVSILVIPKDFIIEVFFYLSLAIS